jgi:hypothetical protein
LKGFQTPLYELSEYLKWTTSGKIQLPVSSALPAASPPLAANHTRPKRCHGAAGAWYLIPIPVVRHRRPAEG